MFKKYPTLLGYLLTYFGAAGAVVLSGLLSWQAAGRFLTSHITDANGDGIDALMRFTADNLVTVLFALAILALAYQMCVLVLSPIFVRLTLNKLPEKRRQTIIWLEMLYFASPLVLLGAIKLFSRGYVSIWIVAAWVILSPILARLIATRHK